MKLKPTHSNELLYVGMVEEAKATSDKTYVKTFWAYAAHIGEAIDLMTKAAQQDGFLKPRVSEIDPYEPSQLCAVEQLYSLSIGTKEALTTPTRYFYPSEPVLNIPEGVIVSCYDDSDDSFEAGYTSYADDECYYVDVVLDEATLLATFMQLISTFETIKVSWIEVLAEWEEAPVTQLFTNETLNNANAISNFLENTKQNILKNGFVKFTVYSADGATNLLIDDHKQICLITKNKTIQQTIENKLSDMCIFLKKDLRQISNQVHHWHYLPIGALDRRHFIDYITSNGFNLWQEIPI